MAQKGSIRPGDLDPWFGKELLERFGRYVAIHTTSDPHVETCPSSPGQWDLALVLEAELRALGLVDVELTDQCYVVGRLPATPGHEATEPVGFLAHMDTSSDSSGKDVKLVVHRNWQGGVIPQERGPGIDPAAYPELLAYKGKTILTSDGSTLLGADDKAGVAEIMTALAWIVAHPEFAHGPLDIVFTPDEEIGRGVEKLPYHWLRAKVAYTLDGDEDGSYNEECFSAWAAEVTCTGVAMHPGYSRGRMVNAISMATMFAQALPRSESPEATDGRFGFYSVQEIQGTMESTTLRLILRDFDAAEVKRRVAFLETLAKAVEGAFPGGRVEVKAREQYKNMVEYLGADPRVVSRLVEAISMTGAEPWSKPIRGGTDGARLSEKGVLTPNIFAGGHNFHSVREWVSLETMERATRVILNLCTLWAQGR